MPQWLIARLNQSLQSRMIAMALFGADGEEDPPPATDAGDSDPPPVEDAQDGDDDNDPLTGLTPEQLREAAQSSHDAARKARRENAELRKRQKETEARLEELEGRDKSALEKAQTSVEKASTENATLREENARLKLEMAVQSAAAEAQFRDVRDVIGQIDLSSARDEDGDIDTSAIARQVRKLAKDKPYLLATVSFGGGDGGGRDAAQLTDSEKEAERTKQMSEHYEHQGMVPMPQG